MQGYPGSIWAEENPNLSPKPIQGSRSKVAACPMLCSLVQGGRQRCLRTSAAGGSGEGCLELSRWPGSARRPQTQKAPPGPLLQALLWPRQSNPEGPSSNSLGKETHVQRGSSKTFIKRIRIFCLPPLSRCPSAADLIVSKLSFPAPSSFSHLSSYRLPVSSYLSVICLFHLYLCGSN